MPDVPFPRVNEAEIVQRRIKEATSETMMGGLRALGLYVIAPMAVVGAAWYMRSLR